MFGCSLFREPSGFSQHANTFTSDELTLNSDDEQSHLIPSTYDKPLSYCNSFVKVSLDAKALPPGSGRGNLSSRVVFAGERWQSRDLCIHGQELKWHCAECDEYFKNGHKPKHKKRS